MEGGVTCPSAWMPVFCLIDLSWGEGGRGEEGKRR